MVGGCTICDFEARLDNDEECRSTLFTTEAAENAIWSDPLKVASTADCFHKKEEANRVEKGDHNAPCIIQILDLSLF